MQTETVGRIDPKMTVAKMLVGFGLPASRAVTESSGLQSLVKQPQEMNTPLSPPLTTAI